MTSTSHKNQLNTPDVPCKYCGAKAWFIGHYVDAGGQAKYPWVCMACGKRSQIFAKRGAVLAAGVQPKELQSSTPPPVCEVCGKEGAELHHWAPSAIFGHHEAEKWPTSFLCQQCHARWHHLVTPTVRYSD